VPMSATLMVQLCLPGAHPGLAEVAETLGLDSGELDPDFGVIATDPARGLYAVRIAAEAAPRAREALAARGIGGPEGVFSDPGIDPAGEF
jgi:hypothetical protein